MQRIAVLHVSGMPRAYRPGVRFPSLCGACRLVRRLLTKAEHVCEGAHSEIGFGVGFYAEGLFAAYR